MATTTTNFGWDIPQSTDLVKDGATAIAALGQDIDTALVDLKGGTTGQVLAKASGSDLDFSWVAQDDSNAIQNAIVDAKGDLIAATANDTPARLAVGTNGQVLTADSTAATGLAWATAGGGDLVRITTQTFTTSAAVNIDSCFSTTYDNYIVKLNVNSSASSNALQMRFRTGGTTNTTSNYGNSWTYNGYGGGATGNLGSASGSNILYLQDITANPAVVNMDINNPFTSFNTMITYLGNQGNGYAVTGAGQFATTTSFDGISIISAAGTITGTISIYGYKKA